MFRIEQGDNFGWPFCCFDYGQQKMLLDPEYGGDGKTTGRCSEFKTPIATFPAHWAPVAMTFYDGSMFPAKYKGGAFIAFHGSWNRAPMPQDGYNVTFQPFVNGKPSGKFEVFASGFASGQAHESGRGSGARGRSGCRAGWFTLHNRRPKGKLWRVIYTGK